MGLYLVQLKVIKVDVPTYLVIILDDSLHNWRSYRLLVSFLGLPQIRSLLALPFAAIFRHINTCIPIFLNELLRKHVLPILKSHQCALILPPVGPEA